MNDKNQKRQENTGGGKSLQQIKRVISSVIIAIVVWFLIVNVVNPRINVSMNDVPVRFIGEGYLRERGFVVVDKDEIPAFSIKVRGTRTDLIAGMDRIRVEIDLSAVDKEGKFTVTPTVTLPDYLSLEKQRFSGVELSIEHSYEKTIPVAVEQITESRRKNKDKVIKSVPEFDEVKVTGSRTDVEAVKNAIVTVNVDDISESGKFVYSLKLVDEAGNVLPEDTSVFCSNSTVPVINTIYERKTVPCKVEIPDALKTKYLFDYTDKDLSVSTIDIGISKGSQVPDHVVLTIPEKEYEAGDAEVKLEIKDVEDIYIPETEIILNTNVEKLVEKNVTVTPELKNVPGGMTGSSEALNIKVFAPEGMTDEIKAEVDCSGFVHGQNHGKLKLTDRRVVLEEDITVSVTLR